MGNLSRNLRRGVTFGLVLATACSAWALVASLLAGSATVGPPGAEIHVATLVAAYYAGGLLCGAVAGLLLPLGRSPVGAAVGGAAAALPLYAAMYVARRGMALPTGADLAAVITAAMIVGGAAGVILRRVFLDPVAPKPGPGSSSGSPAA